ncbi:MogA/MoaB family molybdenum cofactor biosynthesis protein [Candidatus Formimonas warabiya]|uniref:Molybdenum cofactor biosynthesis protein n=1 Tax=Formimonas warabiya TaxID=1761012 RepID=A0A3G1KXU9_FORW1|nr:MogA/MoaB family molybdenum cofactor biosynthesis protein [Candidatus Formimonas warabiya]ATW27227.1 molybdenum cofactor biosynthesis protein [Candidatus Formimonas warabiya]
MIKIGVITASDKGARGERVDLSGPAIKEMVASIGGEVIAYAIVPDDQILLQAKLKEYADELRVDLIFTTGGTGFSPRDVTPEATLAVVDRLAPGIAEAMRLASLKITPKAMLSRATSGIRGKTLIVNLPGSPKAVKECLEVILTALPHGIEILRGEAQECARP